jgi:HSP20 family protein
MALIRWQPFREMEALQRDMNRMFESLAPMEEGQMQQSFMPLAEMEETEDAIHLKVEVPGMSADDLDVQVTKEAVMITGERKTESKSEKNGMKRSEFRYGRFSRTIPLSTRIDNTKVKGDYQDGILILELPKAEDEKNKVTKVNLGSGSNETINASAEQSNESQSKNGSQSNPEASQAQATAS